MLQQNSGPLIEEMNTNEKALGWGFNGNHDHYSVNTEERILIMVEFTGGRKHNTREKMTFEYDTVRRRQDEIRRASLTHGLQNNILITASINLWIYEYLLRINCTTLPAGILSDESTTLISYKYSLGCCSAYSCFSFLFFWDDSHSNLLEDRYLWLWKVASVTEESLKVGFNQNKPGRKLWSI